LYFEENQGQTAGEVRFVARAGGYTAFLASHETVLLYRNRMPGQKDSRGAVVRMKLAGSLDSSTIRGGQKLPGIVNYLIGNDPSKWHTRIPTYAEVDYDRVYPGVDLAYRPDGKQLEFDFRVAAGANPDQIRMTYSGASKMHLNAAGDLVLDTDAGPASILKPVAYQDVDGKRVPVAANYAMLPRGEVGFHLGSYDRSRPLVIDPTVGPSVYYSTYLGSGNYDTFKSIAVDPAGEAFICGSTTADNFPASGGAYETSPSANYFANDIPAGFVTALNATGTGIIYSTYISGTSTTSVYGGSLAAIAVNSAGNAFVGGQTDDGSFPTYKGFRTTIPSSRSGYEVAVGLVFELNTSGDGLVYSTFLGGGDFDGINAIAVDSSSNAYVTGTNDIQGGSLTTSGFPLAGTPIWGHFTQQNLGAGFDDAFASKISPPSSGNATLVYSTVIGSAGSSTPFTYGTAIAVDSSGDAYVTGTANCDIGDHGGTIGTNLNMTHVTRAESEYVNNVWVLELNPAGSQAVYIAYLGGSAPSGTDSPDTSVGGIAVDSSGQAYVAGTTEATNFQTTSGAYQTSAKLAGTSNAGNEQADGFVTVIGANGASIVYSTYLNGSTVSAAAVTDGYYGSPYIVGIALGTGGQFAVAGAATTTNFPTAGSPAGIPLLDAFPGCPSSCAAEAAFITKFTTSGLVYSTYLGASDGLGYESVSSLASNGTDMYLITTEAENNLYSGGAFDLDNSSGAKEMIVRISDAAAESTTLSVDDKTASVSTSSQPVSLTSDLTATSTVSGGTVTYTVTNSSSTQIGSAVTSGIVSNGVTPSTNYTLPANTPGGTYTIHASYRGAESFLGSTATGNLVVGASAASTTTAVASSVNPSTYGQSVSFTATVSSSTASPTGTVQFVVDGTDFGSAVALSAAGSKTSTATSQATTTLSVAGSPHSVTVNYLNTDGSFSDSSGSLSGGQTVNLATQATLSVTGVPGTAQAYNAQFTVGSSGGSGTGAVTFSTTGVCSVSGTTVTMTSGTGSCSVTANKAADSEYAAASSAASSVNATLATEATLSVTGVPGTAQAYNAQFTVGSSGGSGTGAVTFGTTGVCSVSGTTVTMTSGTGSCSVTASKAADSNYASATSAASSVNAALATEATLSVTGVPLVAQAYNAQFTVGSSGGSGTGAVTFGTTGVCSVSGTTVTMTSGTGSCSVTANKAADSNYASASSAASSVNAALAAQATLSVTGVPVTAQGYNSSFTVGSSGGSGTGAVTFGTTGVCSVSGTTVTMTSASGNCSVTATKAADSNYSSKTSVASSVNATLGTQATLTVTGVPVSAQVYNAQFTVGSSGGSGTGAVTFGTTGVCSVSGSTVTMTSGTGSCSVTATKAADTNYASASSAAASVNAALATEATLAVTGVPLVAQAYNAQFTVGSSGGSGTGTVTFGTTGVCSVSGSTVTMTGGTGSCSVTATKAADTNYASASSAAASVNAALATEATLSITGVPATQAYNTSFTVGTSGGSGTGAVTFGTTGVCSVSGATVTMTSGTGTCSVTASKAADSNYASATSAAASATAALATEATLTVTGVPATQTYNTSFTVGTSGGSGTGAVTFGTTGVCSVSGATVTMTSGTGSCSVTASKAADSNYASATSAAASANAALATEAALTVTGVPGTAQPYNAQFTVGSSGGSGTGAVTFGTTGVCSVSGATVTMTSGTGSCSVTANKAADSNYASASSPASSVTAALAAEATLSVTGVPGTAQPYNAQFTVGSSGGSGTGAVTFGTTGVCSVSGSTVTMTSGTGSCSVTAFKAADTNYASATSAASPVAAALATEATLSVTGVPATAQTYQSTFTVGSSGGSGTGAVTFGTTGVCSVSGTTVTMTSGTGTCSVTAFKAADTNYASATSAALPVAAALATEAALAVTGVPLGAQAYNAQFTVGSSGGSGTGAVTFGTTGVCSVSGAAVTMTSGTGTCSVTANKAADSNYASASSPASPVTAALAPEATLSVTGVPASAQAYNAQFAVGTSGGSGTGAVTFGTTGVCSVSGTTVTMTGGTGTCSVTASKAADTNYASTTSAASSVTAALAAEATLTVTGVPTAAQIYNTSFTVGTSGGSGTGAVTLGTTGVCSLSGTTVTMTSGTGTCSVTASKAADTNYASATSAASSVTAALAAEATLSVTGVPATAQTYQSTFTVGSSGGSGTGAVAFGATGACSVSGTTVTMTSGTGTCSVTATKAADSNYASASSAAAPVSAALSTQTVFGLASSGNESLLQNPVTFTAQVVSPIGTPTGTVNFLDGATLIGSGALTAGVATFTTSTLKIGSHVISAVYSGDTNFATAASGKLTQTVADFGVSPGTGSSGTGTVEPGGSIDFTIGISPTQGSSLPIAAVLTVSGLPAGATVKLAPSTWTQLTSTSWQLPANTPLSDVTVTIIVPPQTAKSDLPESPGRRVPPLLWGVLLVPFAGKLRRAGKRMGRTLSLLLILTASAVAMIGLSGCVSGNGFFSQAPQTYTVTVTLTAGNLSHATNLTLTVQ
jgi:hypothetical protein